MKKINNLYRKYAGIELNLGNLNQEFILLIDFRVDCNEPKHR